MSDLLPVENEKNDAFSKIMRYMEHADIVLSPTEDKILSRWCYIDVLLRERKHSIDTIIERVRAKFSVSPYTAENDIWKTQALFERSRKVSKRYMIVNHIEDITMQIEKVKYDKSLYALLPKLLAEKTKALNSLPEEINKTVLPPPVFIFQAAPGQEISKPMDINAARELAKQKLQNNITDIDHEDLPHGNS